MNMNDVIKMLLKEKEELTQQLKTMNRKMNMIEENLLKEKVKETHLINQVLKHKKADIVTMIYKSGLELSEIRVQNQHVVYKVSNKSYYANFLAKDGTVVIDMFGIDNDGCNDCVIPNVKLLLSNDIIPFCEKHKKEYQ